LSGCIKLKRIGFSVPSSTDTADKVPKTARVGEASVNMTGRNGAFCTNIVVDKSPCGSVIRTDVTSDVDNVQVPHLKEASKEKKVIRSKAKSLERKMKDDRQRKRKKSRHSSAQQSIIQVMVNSDSDDFENNEVSTMAVDNPVDECTRISECGTEDVQKKCVKKKSPCNTNTKISDICVLDDCVKDLSPVETFRICSPPPVETTLGLLASLPDDATCKVDLEQLVDEWQAENADGRYIAPPPPYYTVTSNRSFDFDGDKVPDLLENSLNSIKKTRQQSSDDVSGNIQTDKENQSPNVSLMQGKRKESLIEEDHEVCLPDISQTKERHRSTSSPLVKDVENNISPLRKKHSDEIHMSVLGLESSTEENTHMNISAEIKENMNISPNVNMTRSPLVNRSVEKSPAIKGCFNSSTVVNGHIGKSPTIVKNMRNSPVVGHHIAKVKSPLAESTSVDKYLDMSNVESPENASSSSLKETHEGFCQVVKPSPVLVTELNDVDRQIPQNSKTKENVDELSQFSDHVNEMDDHENEIDDEAWANTASFALDLDFGEKTNKQDSLDEIFSDDNSPVFPASIPKVKKPDSKPGTSLDVEKPASGKTLFDMCEDADFKSTFETPEDENVKVPFDAKGDFDSWPLDDMLDDKDVFEDVKTPAKTKAHTQVTFTQALNFVGSSLSGSESTQADDDDEKSPTVTVHTDGKDYNQGISNISGCAGRNEIGHWSKQERCLDSVKDQAETEVSVSPESEMEASVTNKRLPERETEASVTKNRVPGSENSTVFKEPDSRSKRKSSSSSSSGGVEMAEFDLGFDLDDDVIPPSPDMSQSQKSVRLSQAFNLTSRLGQNKTLAAVESERVADKQHSSTSIQDRDKSVAVERGYNANKQLGSIQFQQSRGKKSLHFSDNTEEKLFNCEEEESQSLLDNDAISNSRSRMSNKKAKSLSIGLKPLPVIKEMAVSSNQVVKIQSNDSKDRSDLFESPDKGKSNKAMFDMSFDMLADDDNWLESEDFEDEGQKKGSPKREQQIQASLQNKSSSKPMLAVAPMVFSDDSNSRDEGLVRQENDGSRRASGAEGPIGRKLFTVDDLSPDCFDDSFPFSPAVVNTGKSVPSERTVQTPNHALGTPKSSVNTAVGGASSKLSRSGNVHCTSTPRLPFGKSINSVTRLSSDELYRSTPIRPHREKDDAQNSVNQSFSDLGTSKHSSSPSHLSGNLSSPQHPSDHDESVIVVRRKKRNAILESPSSQVSVSHEDNNDDRVGLSKSKVKATVDDGACNFSDDDFDDSFLMTQNDYIPQKQKKKVVTIESDDDFDESVISKPKKSKTNCKPFTAHGISSDDSNDFEDSRTCDLSVPSRQQITDNWVSDDSDNFETSVSHGTKAPQVSHRDLKDNKQARSSSSGKRKHKRGVAGGVAGGRMFLEEEADLSSGEEASSDEAEGSDQDVYENSFIADTQASQHADTSDMHALYLESVRSPVRELTSNSFLYCATIPLLCHHSFTVPPFLYCATILLLCHHSFTVPPFFYCATSI